VIGGQGTGGSIEYKENFNGLASLLSQYPQLLQRATFVFVPGDNDLWASSFSAGATSMIPKMSIPDMFTSRVQGAFNSANPKSRSPENDHGGRAVWTTNPTRLSIFGPVRELVVFRDDISGRLRRTSLNFTKRNESDSNPDDNDRLPDPPVQPEVTPPPGDDITTASQQATAPNVSPAQKLAKTILDQGCLSPFPTTIRPILWNYASALQLYPLPSALVLADSEAEPFAITYEGCHVMNPGKLVPDSGTGTINWLEYDMLSNKGRACTEQL
jgi:DNA polymerase epsilon subunit 2